MKCNSCNSEWTTSVQIDRCPFCGASLKEDTFTGTFDDVPSCIKYIIKTNGSDILMNKNKFLALAGDFLPGFSTELKLLGIAVNAGVYPGFTAISESEIENKRSEAVLRLTELHFIGKQHAEKAVSWIIDALFDGYSAPAVQQSTTAQQSAPTVQQSATAPVQATTAPDPLKKTITFPDGEYLGEILAGKRHGFGTMTYSDYYAQTPNICKYEGEWKDDKRHGFGIAEFPDGTAYKGSWENGLRCGHGVWYFTKSQTSGAYNGYWQQDKFHGNGTLYSPGGQVTYEGDFAYGKYHGKGKLFFSDDSFYKGEFSKGEKHGLGAWIRADGSVRYKGYWYEGKMDSNGKNFFSSRNFTVSSDPEGMYCGETYADEKHGHGCLKYAAGDPLGRARYVGQWHNGKHCGWGTMYFTNGDKYEGEWKNGRYFGKGRYTKKSGRYFTAHWCCTGKTPKYSNAFYYDITGKETSGWLFNSFYIAWNK